MTSRDFEEAWAPVIGDEGAEQLRRYRRLEKARPLMALLAVGSGVLFASGGTVASVAAVIMGGTGVVLVGAHTWVGWRTMRALAAWFGVKRVRWIPRTTPQRFDDWRKRRGYATADERRVAAGATDG